MVAPAAHPVQTLREHATALEAALSVCLADPHSKAVHKVRTETRRIEAQLALLALIPGLPSYGDEAKKALKRLRKLRRGAGRVRDLDVQRKLIKEQATEAPAAQQSREDKTMARDLRRMRKLRKRQRKSAARDLLHLIEKRGPKISAALEEVLAALEPYEDLSLSITELLDLVDRGFSHQEALHLRSPSEDQLHDLRKAAKVARYQAENAAESTTAKLAADRYQQLQDQGGQWHDWLQLACDAEDELGGQHAAALRFTALRDQHLTAFRDCLDAAAALSAK